MKNIIFHTDVNSAFLSWKAAYRIAHKGGRLDPGEIPFVVGGDKAMRHEYLIQYETYIRGLKILLQG